MVVGNDARSVVRLWFLVSNHLTLRRCSLAYGTPLQVHCAQYDVPHPSVDDICSTAASAYHRAAASIFVALTTLTDVLARYLEHVYHVSKTYPQSSVSPVDLERMLSEWEESLSGDIRRIVLRGTHLDTAGAANFRLAYLAVKLLLRRIQLALHKSTMQVEDDTGSPFYIQAERAAEDIAHLVQELDETQLRGFWIPVHAFSLTSASMFLLRSGLRKRNQNRNTPLGIAREMIDTLRRHRQVFDWDLSDHCLGHCGELIERIGMADSDSDMTFPGLSGLSDDFDVDTSILDELFLGVAGFSEGFGL